MTQPSIIKLDHLPNLLDKPGASLRRFGGAHVMLQVATSKAGDGFEPHSHHNEQVVLVLEGRMRLDVGPPEAVTSHVLGPGDGMVIPPHVPHGGETLEDCRIIDAFSPPRTTVLGEEEPE